MNKKSYIILSLLVMLIGCTKELSLTPLDYVKWVEEKENGLHHTLTIKNVQYTAQYKPIDYVIANEIRKEVIDQSEYNKKREELDGFDYFTFKVSLDGKHSVLEASKANPEQYDQLVQYFAFSMQHDFKLVTSTDTISCGLYHFERAYGMVPFDSFVLGFKKDENQILQKTLIYNDKILGTGPVKIQFDRNTLSNLPTIVIS